MCETPAGLLLPLIRDEKCIVCGRCRKVCTGAGFDLDLPEHVDPFKGKVHGAYVGHAINDSVRAGGQSGGVVSALLLFLLETGKIDAAMVTAMPNDGSLRPRAALARTGQQILAAQGSKYCPVASNAVLAETPADARIAAVGVSCQMHGIYVLAQDGNALARTIQYRIGLVCDRTLLYSCIDHMALTAGLALKDIAGLEYRSKARNGWPGEVCFHLGSGQKRYFPSSLRTSTKDYFTPPRCRLCFDKMNIFCDVTIGDAWGISESPQGDSIVIARTENAASLLQDACSLGFLKLREVAPNIIFENQGVERRRRDFSAFMSECRKLGRYSPEYKGLKSHCLASGDSATCTCNRKLLFNYRVASTTTRKDILAIVRRRLFLSRIQSLAVRSVKGVWRESNSLLRPPKRR